MSNETQGEPLRRVTADLVLQVEQPSVAIFQIAASDPALSPTDSLLVTVDGHELSGQVVQMPGSGPAHRFALPQGRVQVSYQAAHGPTPPPEVTESDLITYLRPSRYAESDRFAATAAAEFGGITDHHDLLSAVSSWVGTRLVYVPGASRPTDGAVQTLLAREGVCRDYAHLVIALLRARDVPARLVAVYAPGLSPMDFHAVAEAAIDGTWWAVDATALAPRSAMLRISTGRDAADTAFLATYGGRVNLLESWVSAVIDGYLPYDDVTSRVSIT